MVWFILVRVLFILAVSYAAVVTRPFTVNVTLTAPVSQVDAAAIMANPAAYYFNVHTQLNPTGAARGQLVRAQ